MSHSYLMHEIARLPAPNDNTAIATRRLARGTTIRHNADEFVLDHDILEGHRFAVRPINPDESLLSWGFRFGIATRPILPGNYVVNASVLAALRERNVTLDLPAEPNFRNQIERYQFKPDHFSPGEQVARYDTSRTFMGYRRPEGRGVGTRNDIVVLGLSSRAASYARALAIRLNPAREGLENVDSVAAIAHTEGSGDDPINNFEYLLRTLAGMMVHPNVGAVLAVAHPEDAVTANEMRHYLAAHKYPIHAVPHEWLTLSGDLQTDLMRGGEIITEWLPLVNQTARTPESIAHLRVALQCGGSDAFSGVSGNPLEGAVAREIVKYGGTANLCETDELVGAEEYILQNVRDAQTAHEFLDAIETFKARLAWHGVTAEGNPSGGNQYRGLYNISLKSLGAAMKKDPAVRLDYVIQYAERLSEPGFYFMDSPGNDLEGIAGQVASGCNLIFFTTGNGSITNFPFVPTIKIVTTTGRYNLLSNEMDVNAGAYLDGTPLDALTQETLDLTIRIASGELSKGERAQHSQVSIWRNWRQTDARSVNVILQMPAPDGNPLPLKDAAWDYNPLAYPIYDDGAHIAHKFVGLVMPTSLCAAQVAQLATDRLNQRAFGVPNHLARYATLTHTEGCGVTGDSYLALYKRTMLNYMLHPMVRFGLFLEHGCEMTHNDAMQHRLREMGGSPAQFGWASIQLDGGIDKVLQKIENWFETRIAGIERTRRELILIESARIGLLVAAPPPPFVAAALAQVTRDVVNQGGTIVLPSTSPLLTDENYTGALLHTSNPQPSLAYGQFAAQHGLHIMDAPSQHWVETLSGLGATGVEIILTYVDALPVQTHPFIPLLQFATRRSLPNRSEGENSASHDADLILQGDAQECAAQLEQGMLQMLAGKVAPRALGLETVDFQITRSLLGVSV